MVEKFYIFCKTLLVSDIGPSCQKLVISKISKINNEPSSVVEEIIAIYFLQGYHYKTILKFLAEHQR